jgi:hypothetical protein
MRGPDLDKENSEKKRSLAEFLAEYNKGLPVGFPRVSLPLLRVFNQNHPTLFKEDGLWSLDQHRKRVMDWLPNYLKAQAHSGV